MKALKTAIISITTMTFLSCSETQPEYNFNFFLLDNCKICSNPFQRVDKVEEMLNAVNSIKNEYGEDTNIVDGFLVFDDITINNPPAGKNYSDFYIPYYYNSPNCWTEPRRRGDVTVHLDQELLKQNSKGWDLFLKSKDGDKFDLFVLNPKLKYTNPDHACDGSSFYINNYTGILLVPKEAIQGSNINAELLSQY